MRNPGQAVSIDGGMCYGDHLQKGLLGVSPAHLPVQTPRYAKKFILGISIICLR
jgi:hypothetical protein